MEGIFLWKALFLEGIVFMEGIILFLEYNMEGIALFLEYTWAIDVQTFHFNDNWAGVWVDSHTRFRFLDIYIGREKYLQFRK